MFAKQQLKSLITNLLFSYVYTKNTSHVVPDVFPGIWAYKSEFLEGLVKYVRQSRDCYFPSRLSHGVHGSNSRSIP